MNRDKRFALVLALAWIVSPVVADEAKDERKTVLTYTGSGYAERGPDYAEVYFNLSVRCQPSAAAVRKAISDVSNPIWLSISSKVGDSSQDEKNVAYWGNIGNINEESGTEVIRVKDSLKGKTINRCTRQEVKEGEKVASTFSGNQRIGVRAADMGWLEGLVNKVKTLPQDKRVDTVKLSSQAIDYSVTEATKRDMLKEVQAEAEEAAIGNDSQYASDKKTLKFKSATYLGKQLGFENGGSLPVGSPVKRGGAPLVTAEIPFSYEIFHRTRNLLDKDDTAEVGATSSYEVQGRAVGNADYAQANVSVYVGCQETKNAANEAIKAPGEEVLGWLRDYHKGKTDSETDKIENNEASDASEYYPYEPIAWKKVRTNPNEEGVKPQYQEVVSEYRDLCSGAVVPAPEKDKQLKAYWNASRELALRSSDFEGILNEVEKRQAQYGQSAEKTTDARVTVSDAYGQVTLAKAERLKLSARENATACVLDPNGLLAQDSQRNGFTCAYLRDVRIGSNQAFRKSARSLESFAAPAAAMADSAGGAEGGLEIEPVVKAEGERPVWPLKRTYQFRFQVMSANYTEGFKGE